MAKLIVYLGDQERTALQRLAQRELRAPRAQAALILREELIRQGMLAEKGRGTETAAGSMQAAGEPAC